MNDLNKAFNSKIDYSMMQFCINNNFALQFVDELPTLKNCEGLIFRLSDNFLVKYCEYFLEPIIYTFDGKALTTNLNEDIRKIYRLMGEIFKFDFVEQVELRFSFVEVDEEDYEVHETTMDKMEELILNKFLSTRGFPVMNIIVKRML